VIEAYLGTDERVVARSGVLANGRRKRKPPVRTSKSKAKSGAKKKKPAARKTPAKPSPGAKAAAKPVAGEGAAPSKMDDDERRQEAVDLVADTVEALMAERGEEDKIWGSMVKQALKRRNPGFNESYYGFRLFTNLLEEAARRGAVTLERDENSANYRVRLPASEG